MHLRQWQRIEGGAANVTLETLSALCNALGVDASVLLRERAILRAV